MDHGAIFSFLGGASYNFSPRLQEQLTQSKYVGSGLQLNGIGITYGGGITIMAHSGLVIGINGYGYGLSSTGAKGDVKEKTGGGIIDFGYAAKKRKKILSYPYIGIGGFGTKFVYENTSAKDVYIGSAPTKPGMTTPYSTGGLAFELGYSFKYFAFNMHRKGFKRYGAVLGFDAGCQYYMALGKWRNMLERNLLGDFSRPLILSPYVRVSIGLADLSTKIWSKNVM